MFTFDQILILLDRIGICGAALFFLLFHMAQEEVTRRKLAREIKERREKGVD